MRVAVLVIAAAVGLTACQDRVQIPDAPRGTCFHVARLEGGEVRFNPLPDPQPNMENCAARLEEMRIRFLRMGGTRREVMGAYGNQFLFVDGAGVALSRSLDGGRFNALRRSNDGRLVIPGAFELPEGTTMPEPGAAPPEPAG